MLPFLLSAAASLAAPAAPIDALGHDDRGRPTLVVRLNEHPFAMIVDTAAQTSLIVPGVAKELGIAPLQERIGVSGATGGGGAALYPVGHFASKLFDRHDVAMVEMPIGLTNARGIVGMDIFAGKKLLIDGRAGEIGIAPTSAAPSGWRTVRGRADDDGFLGVPLTIDGTMVEATVDTGAAVSVANDATLRALGWKPDDPRLATGGTINGSAGGGQRVRTARIGRLSLGPVTLSNVTLIVTGGADGGNDAPSLLLGSDILNLLDAYAIDFGRTELQIRLPQPPTPAVAPPPAR